MEIGLLFVLIAAIVLGLLFVLLGRGRSQRVDSGTEPEGPETKGTSYGEPQDEGGTQPPEGPGSEDEEPPASHSP